MIRHSSDADTGHVVSQFEKTGAAGLRLVLIDPHEPVRAGLARRLRTDSRIISLTVTAAMADASEMLEAVVPDAVIIDPGRPGSNGRHELRALIRLRERTSWFLIVVHTATHDEWNADAAREIGADLVLLKGMRTDELVDRLQHEIRVR